MGREWHMDGWEDGVGSFLPCGLNVNMAALSVTGGPRAPRLPSRARWMVWTSGAAGRGSRAWNGAWWLESTHVQPPSTVLGFLVFGE